jgi:menaquinone-dependent protoporphyrinogen oxidase
MARILVLYATIEGHTARIAERVAGALRSHGHEVDMLPACPEADLPGYEAVVVGASIHYGHHPASLRTLLRRNRAALAARPAAFFSVSLGAKERYLQRFLRQVGWQPQATATFAGALQYSKYGPVKRLVMLAFATMMGRNTDTSRDCEYTDWDAVDRFSEAFARHVLAGRAG